MATLTFIVLPLMDNKAMALDDWLKIAEKIASLWPSWAAASLRAVMSVRMETYFSTLPSAPAKGAIMLSTQYSFPSLARLQISPRHGLPASFTHTPASAIPEVQDGAAHVRVLVGQALGVQSPVATLSPTLYLDVALPAGTVWTLPMLADEQAVYGVDGDLHVNGETLAPHTMAVLAQAATLTAGPEGARLAVIGGQPLGRRLMWWNFVSTSKARIDQAAQAWESGDAAQGMGQVPGESERIPLPAR